VAIHLADGEATISNGSLQALVSADGRIRYLHAPSGRVLLAEPEPACTDRTAAISSTALGDYTR